MSVTSSSKNSFIQNLLRPHLRDFTPYASARRTMSGGNLWLNANESPYGRPYRVETEELNRYPDFQNRALNQAYAEYAGLHRDQVISHRGSDESIELVIRTFCEPGRDKILICPPTYGMYGISAAINHNETVAIPLRADDWQLDLPAIEAALAQSDNPIKVVFLCNPSNPLGNALREEDMLSVIERCRGKALVVVDEAYIEFVADPARTSMVRYLEQFENLLVMRTLSKAFGLAGIRVGFSLASPNMVQALLPVLAPYPLPDVSVQIARQALTLDQLIATRQNTFEVVSERTRLMNSLQELPWVQKVYPSVTNFILLQVTDANALMAHCQAEGVLIRNQSSQLGLTHCVRITVGSPEENERLLEVLAAFRDNA
ncbi:histidinol-phosphate transaminase [Aliidiomarina sanyensis]|uniref:Histidinol-phosphate aminotransferase n=1 Tax=Aliidiomarina sanyensis TaxID=1249555 RepID=A0A432WNG4_9GAMM|nr:histidinol-phosphate transaminase [Aliidiomarina sanyensis]RUO35342.1 histidinol-phosphate transaminase [Aliidiomarina sanyensis]